MMKANVLICLLLLLAGSLSGQSFDIADHPLPFADGFVDPAPEGLLINPALMPSFASGWVAAEHERLFWGFGEPLHRSGISAVYNTCCQGVGVFASMLSAPIEYRWTVNTAVTMRLGRALTATVASNRWGLYAGAGIGIVARGYNTSAMALAQPDDPWFATANPSKMGLTASAGIAYRHKFGQVFAGVFDLLAPNLAIGEEADRILPAGQVGATIRRGITSIWMVAQYSPRYGNLWLDINPIAGIASRPVKYLSLQGFLSGHSVGAGITFTPQYDHGFALIYRISYPIEYSHPFSGLTIPTHRFGLEFRLKPPEPLFPDVKPIGWNIDGKPIPGEILRVALAIQNDGNFSTPDIPIAIERHENDAIRISSPPLQSNAGDTIWFDWIADNPGDYRIRTVLNRKVPELSAPPEFIESDPDNNESEVSVHIFAPPKPSLSIENDELHLLQLFSVAEDEPIVPIFFFSSEDTSLDERFDATVEIISERMRKNPDVELILNGYIVDGETDSVAIARAEAVMQAFYEEQPELKERIRISGAHDFHSKRAKREGFQGTRLGDRYTAQENRRVELSARISIGKQNFSEEQLPDDSFLSEIREILTANPDVFLAVQAVDIPAALRYKERLLTMLGDGFSDKIFSQDGAGDGIIMTLCAAGLIYRPPQVIQPHDGYEIEPEWDTTRISVHSEGELPIRNNKILIFSDDDTIAQFADARAEWDWDVSSKGLPQPGSEFRVKAVVQDSLGQVRETPDEKLRVVVKNINEVQQRLILLQFVFAGELSESEFCNARMEYVARRIIERVGARDVDVMVTGHTDTTGTFAGNEKLAKKRADEQMMILRRYLRSMLDMDESELDLWLAGKNATLIAKGYGLEQPFAIIRLDGEDEISVMVGDNTLPEGRIKNRRVEILFNPRNSN